MAKLYCLSIASKGVYQINYFDSSCLNGQAILLEYNTLKGVYQINYLNFNFILTLIITLTSTLTLYLASFTVALLVYPFIKEMVLPFSLNFSTLNMFLAHCLIKLQYIFCPNFNLLNIKKFVLYFELKTMCFSDSTFTSSPHPSNVLFHTEYHKSVIFWSVDCIFFMEKVCMYCTNKLRKQGLKSPNPRPSMP